MKILNNNTPLENSKTCFLGSFPPRECGIATFTKDLSSAMDRRFNPKLKSKIIALKENQNFYNYNDKVIAEIDSENIEDYINIAKEINNQENIKLVCIQHEFGLFGGEYGSYLISFLEIIKKPVIVTFHSVLPNPDKIKKKVVKAIALRCSAIIVMANIAIDILVNDYGIEKSKIQLIHHGIPNVKYEKNNFFKKKFKLSDRIVLTTFGLLGRGKGIEYMIKALPDLVKKYPNLIYLIIGETHPKVREMEGEEYRKELLELIKDLKLENNVKFYNRFLPLQEIIDYLNASDIYICTNLEKNQITSGTLAYALGCGRAVVSTSTLYSEEILSNGRGILVKEFKNPVLYTEAIEKILSNKELKTSLEKNAYSFSRQMIWSNVAYNYLKIFNKIIKLRDETIEKFPIVKLTHLNKMTDSFGMIQFAKNSEPDKDSGYTLDDNSRALITAVLHYKIFGSQKSLGLAKTYLDFIEHVQEENGNFKNICGNNQECSKFYSEDSFSRAIWSLGFTINKSIDLDLVEKAKRILNFSLSYIEKLKSPRAEAFALIGLCYCYRTYKKEEILFKIKKLAEILCERYGHESSENWQWFESYLTYSNAKLPKSLFLAYEAVGNKKYLEVAEKTFNFLSNLCIVEGKLSPIGQNGWYNRNGKRAFFDQQPVDVSSMVQTFLIANSITKNKDYYNKAVLSFNWFLGKNHLNQMIYDETTGGCFDGLGEYSLNLNQGAESTIAYLMARLFLEEFKKNNGEGI